MSENWWDDLTPEQNRRLSALIDSRVRLLGEGYPTAYRSCTERISSENREYVMGEKEV